MQISGLPSTTTFDDNTVIAVENVVGGSNVTSKLTGQTLKTNMLKSISSAMSIQSTSAMMPSGSNSVSLTAPSVAGYSFFCWIGAFSSGSVVTLNFANPGSASSSVWRPGPTTSSLSITAFAIYLMN